MISESVKVNFTARQEFLLKRFLDSPSAGHPDCICSFCNKPITEHDVPIRLWPQQDDGRVIYEYRLHVDCFQECIKKEIFTVNQNEDKFN